MKTRETTEEVSSHGVEKRAERHKSERSAPFATENRGRIGKKIEKRLANLWGRNKITKKAHAGRGHEIKWEMSVNMKMAISFRPVPSGALRQRHPNLES